jgi:phosphoglycolate phosphatase
VKYNAVLFDLDGTLLDTLEDLADSMNAVLEQMDFPTHPVSAYRHFVGDGVINLARRTVPPEMRDDESLIDRCIECVRDEYARRWDNKTAPYDGVPEMLDALGDRGVVRTILSNKPHDFTKLCVEKLLGKWEFQCVQGVGDNVPLKPDPKGAIWVTERVGVRPGEFLYLGDTNTDMQTAVAAGMYGVGALWGFRDADELTASGAKTLIEHPTELINLL